MQNQGTVTIATMEDTQRSSQSSHEGWDALASASHSAHLSAETDTTLTDSVHCELSRLKADLAERMQTQRPLSHSVAMAYRLAIARQEQAQQQSAANE